ncbi:hypothetical protein BRADI_1g55194v3 [Brachypodium distachyon]|uniref:DUF223 domain-containing protein n=1 Tax=Brachypodium distachyon TaxID=15368 RepID=A0A0Q3K7T6_BRADI|nr:hypothetical protein BRADI_1g55194v3 [Brachypodium distachyon]
MDVVRTRDGGTKIEAVAYDDQADRFNTALRTGSAYVFSNVGFMDTEAAVEVEFNLPADLYCSIGRRTVLDAAANIIIPDLPPRFNEFHAVYRQCDRTLADVIGVVVYVRREYVIPYLKSFP